ncbi:hypothetical protein R80B4_02689 [Fibrobacteres bacterium R8-0-B4]
MNIITGKGPSPVVGKVRSSVRVLLASCTHVIVLFFLSSAVGGVTAGFACSVIVCLGTFPLSGLSVYEESLYPEAETLTVQSPTAACFANLDDGRFSAPKAASMFRLPPLWVSRDANAATSVPLTDNK